MTGFPKQLVFTTVLLYSDVLIQKSKWNESIVQIQDSKDFSGHSSSPLSHWHVANFSLFFHK